MANPKTPPAEDENALLDTALVEDMAAAYLLIALSFESESLFLRYNDTALLADVHSGFVGEMYPFDVPITIFPPSEFYFWSFHLIRRLLPICPTENPFFLYLSYAFL